MSDLGATAILGPRSSPTKRSHRGEQEETAPKRRRRKLKHEVQGENWGEDTGEPEAGRTEETPHVEKLTPSSGSYPPKEEELKQNSIFSYMGRPTLRNPAHQILSSHVDSPTHVNQKSQEGTSGMKEQNMSSTQNCDEQGSKVCIKNGSDGKNAPSMTSSDGKNVPSMTSMKYDDQASTVCTFKRGGMCIKHNVVGSKFSVSRKDWAQKKDGTYMGMCIERLRNIPVRKLEDLPIY